MTKNYFTSNILLFNITIILFNYTTLYGALYKFRILQLILKIFFGMSPTKFSFTSTYYKQSLLCFSKKSEKILTLISKSTYNIKCVAFHKLISI
jgi:hypothetical protein